MELVFALLVLGGLAYYLNRANQQGEQRETEDRARLKALAHEIDGYPTLPTVEPGFPLQANENCYWVGPCKLLEYRTKTKRMRYSGAATTIRVMKGVSFRVGSVTPTRETAVELEQIDEGVLVITSKRVFFDGRTKNTSYPWRGILRITPFQNGFEAEKNTGKSPHFLITEDPDRAWMIAVRAHLEAG